MTKYFDNENKRLIFVDKNANADFWDNHWGKFELEKIYPNKYTKRDYVVKTTTKYLPQKAKIIEGGCGIGKQVFKLQKAGYEVIGVDYAKKTIEFVNENKPELYIQLGDVTKLEFEDNYFDAYWSFGVIEHFFDGYDMIRKEMLRVLASGGYLFITFPHMSLLRKLKARLKQYPEWSGRSEENFYQFALSTKKVIQDFEKNGFRLVNMKKMNGIKGFKDEISLLKPLLQKIYDNRSLPGLIVNKLISVLLTPFASHSVLLVLKKEK